MDHETIKAIKGHVDNAQSSLSLAMALATRISDEGRRREVIGAIKEMVQETLQCEVYFEDEDLNDVEED